MTTKTRGKEAAETASAEAVLQSADMRAAFTSSGGLRRFDVAGLSLVQQPASELESGLAGLWLQQGEECVPLLGAGSSGVLHTTDGHPWVGGTAGFTGTGDGVHSGVHARVHYRVDLDFAPDVLAWVWRVHLSPDETQGGPAAPMQVRLVHTQDVGLAPYGAVRTNEYYVSQYLDLTPVELPEHGIALAVRQNMPGATAPWAMIGSLGVGEQWSTDARQLTRTVDGRARLVPGEGLPSSRLQGEHTLVGIASAPLELVPGSVTTGGFFGVLVPDHQAATSPADRSLADAAFLFAESLPAPASLGGDHATIVAGSVFDRGVLVGDDLAPEAVERLFGAERSLVETGPDGDLWSFTIGRGAEAETVTLAAKERAVLRPHGHMLRTGSAVAPDTDLLTSTIWMAGVFASQVSQGHVNRGVAISARRTYLGLMQAHGLRIFVDRGRSEGEGDGLQLLGEPSAWALRPDRARWLYVTGEGTIEVTATAPTDRNDLLFSVRSTGGRVARVLVAAHVALGDDLGQTPAALDLEVDGNRASVALADEPDRGRLTTQWQVVSGDAPTFGGDELLFDDGAGRGEPWFVADLADVEEFTFSLTLDVVPEELAERAEHTLPELWQTISARLGLSLDEASGDAGDGDPGDDDAGGGHSEVEVLDGTLRWFAHNALIHHLSPRGLEQFSGGGWGTRDVSQGPVGLLTALAADDAQRATLLELFRAQNERGDWPQAFDFLPPSGRWAQFESHGDVVFWPVLAAGEYLQLTGDAGFLDEGVAFSGESGPTDDRPMVDHLRQAVAYIVAAMVPGSPLPAYGHGDWNDSLQPADPALAHQMASTWTATLQVHALRQLAGGLRAVGREPELAERAAGIADDTEAALHEVLLVDGELAGYGVFGPEGHTPGGEVELLVHPRDTRTGLTHGVLPWIHAISAQQLDREQANHHLDLIAEHLLGPDGARLFDRPAQYRGGPMEVFQRAEGATFWGREIGLMYTHAHLRYAEALAAVGRAEECWRAMLLVCPTLLTSRLPQARPRQTTCYYSSSDAVFADRYEAEERYPALMAGEVDLEGGWRIYSSGPGLFLRLVTETLLGVTRRADRVELDPVLPPWVDGLTARVPVPDGHVTVTYRVSGSGAGVRSVSVDGRAIEGEPLANLYRAPGVSIDASLVTDGAHLEIEVGA
ncbi:hypothetical protein ACSDQ9_13960 [Aestuariimicrobium soli]|uniref:hypothetical protein n=1 Tax=Aestuariimicrobium soli TaxID=2035834 RepID=UPI003EBD6F6E